MEDLDDVLNGAEDSVSEPEEPTGVEQEVTTPEPEPEPEEPSAKPADLDKELAGLRQALQAERQKRQALETQQQKTPDVFEDQEAFVGHLNQQMSQQLLNERLNMSEYMARKEHPDLDEKIEAYKSIVEQNPSLHQEVMASPSPYHALIDAVTKAQEFEKMKDIDSYKATLRAEIEAELRAKIEGEQSKKKALVDSIPPSLATEQSKSSLSGPAWSGPPSLDELFN